MMPSRPPLTVVKLSDNFGQHAIAITRMRSRSPGTPANLRSTRRLGRSAARGGEAPALFQVREEKMQSHGAARDEARGLRGIPPLESQPHCPMLQAKGGQSVTPHNLRDDPWH
jgi:hypothetical protein